MKITIENNKGEALDIFTIEADDDDAHNKIVYAILDVLDHRIYGRNTKGGSK